MSNTPSGVVGAPRTSRACPQSLTRVALAAVGALGILVVSARTAEAQASPDHRRPWEFRGTTGALVPTGAQRDVLKDAPLSGAQLSYVVRSFAITATFGWARSRDLVSTGDPKLDVFMYDLGAEARAPRYVTGFKPLVGGGKADTRNDLVIQAGLRFTRRRA
jgi:hypothetical protein